MNDWVAIFPGNVHSTEYQFSRRLEAYLHLDWRKWSLCSLWGECECTCVCRFPGSFGLGMRLGGGIGRIQTIQGSCYFFFQFQFQHAAEAFSWKLCSFHWKCTGYFETRGKNQPHRQPWSHTPAFSHTPSLDLTPQLSATPPALISHSSFQPHPQPWSHTPAFIAILQAMKAGVWEWNSAMIR